jgi:glucoamylase
MSTVRRFAREDGALAEQFDQRTGEPSSAKDLGWSHAAFVTAHQARRAAASRG